MNYRNGLSVWNWGSCDYCVDIQQREREREAKRERDEYKQKRGQTFVEIKVGEEWKPSTPKIGLTTRGDWSVMDMEGVVKVIPGNLVASSGEGSL